jgi:ligand-binding SRPBCC domain-containing protein
VCSNGKKGDLMADKTYTLAFTQQVSRPLPEVFNFFSRAENLEVLTPPWLGEMKQIAIGN